MSIIKRQSVGNPDELPPVYNILNQDQNEMNKLSISKKSYEEKQ